jgi:transposase-like protein/transposase
MGKHHTEDYKLSAVRHSLKSDNQVQTCEIFDCKRSSLQRWIYKYQTEGTLSKGKTRRKARKVKREHIIFIRSELKKKPQIYLQDLLDILKGKYPDLQITPQHLGRIVRDNDITRKRLRKIHQPGTYRGKERNHAQEVKEYVETMKKQNIHKIIALDETGIYAALHPTYARCDIGKRCYMKTTDQRVFKKYSLLVAITSKGIVGWDLYEKGAVNSERLTEFIKNKVNGKYEDCVIVMDNAGFHKTTEVKDAVNEGKNKIQNTVPYYPRSNPIEQFFSQLKHYIKKDSPISYEDIKTSIGKAMTKVKEKHLNNYFLHAFNLELLKKDRATRRRKPKVYLD